MQGAIGLLVGGFLKSVNRSGTSYINQMGGTMQRGLYRMKLVLHFSSLWTF